MYKIDAILPLMNEGKRLPDNVYKAIERTSPTPQLGILKKIKRGRGFKIVFSPLGEVKATVRGPSIILTSLVSEIPENCPYIRLVFNMGKNIEFDPVSVNFVFSKEAGNIPQPNYTWSKL